MRFDSRRSVRWSRDVAQVEKLLARLSNRVSELTQVTAQGDNSALCAQLLVSTWPASWTALTGTFDAAVATHLMKSSVLLAPAHVAFSQLRLHTCRGAAHSFLCGRHGHLRTQLLATT